MNEISLFYKDWEELEKMLCRLRISYEVEFTCHIDPNNEDSTIYKKHIKIAPCKVDLGKLKKE